MDIAHLTDPVRSKRFGEPVTIASARMRCRRKGIEHIDVYGQLLVPLQSSLDRAPKREGWEPYFVAVNLTRTPKKWVTYRRPKEGSMSEVNPGSIEAISPA